MDENSLQNTPPSLCTVRTLVIQDGATYIWGQILLISVAPHTLYIQTYKDGLEHCELIGKLSALGCVCGANKGTNCGPYHHDLLIYNNIMVNCSI